MVMTARSDDCGATKQPRWQCCYLQLPKIALMLQSDKQEALSHIENKNEMTEHTDTLKILMGPRSAIHVNHFQVPCRAFFRWDLSWRELVNVTNSYVDSTHFLISTCSTSGLHYGSM
jgi:hypothetical protein